MRVTGLFVYPIKATAAISVQEAEVHPRGLAGDRRWVVVDEGGGFLQQRVYPKLAVVKTRLQGDGGLLVTAPTAESLNVAAPSGEQRGEVTVWRDTVDAADAGSEAAEWFTRFLGVPARLMFMDERAIRPVEPERGRRGDVVSFADAMPLLVATEADLADLNRRLETPVPMSRFRPNLVIDGDAAWDSDRWKRLRVGEVAFEITHPCARCVVTTVDQDTGEKSTDGEPLKTLSTFRGGNKGVLFGQNLVPRCGGAIRVGDRVIVDR